MELLKLIAALAIVPAAFSSVLVAFRWACQPEIPPAAVASRNRRERAFVQKEAAKLAAARRYYDPRRWDRVYSLAYALQRYRDRRELARTDFERAWSPLDADAEGRELYGLIQEARWLARTSEQRKLAEALESRTREPEYPAGGS